MFSRRHVPDWHCAIGIPTCQGAELNSLDPATSAVKTMNSLFALEKVLHDSFLTVLAQADC